MTPDGRRPGLVAAALGAAVVAFGFQQTAVIPAIPEIQAALHASERWSAWLQTGYLVASCVLTPLAGKLGDRLGKRRVLTAALAMFLAGSVGAAVAPTLGWLVACRIVQGGGGAVFPLVIAVARDEVSDGRVGLAIGALTGTFGLGTALGFGVGALIAQIAGWRWIFWVGALAVAIAAAAVWTAVPRSPRRATAGLGLVGGALLTGGLAVLLIVITEGRPQGWGSPWIVGGFALSVLLLVGWGLHDTRAAVPLLDLRVQRERTVLLANLATTALGFVLFGTFFLVPYLVERELGGGTLAGGLYLVPAALGQLVAGPAAPRLAAVIGAKWVYVIGMALPSGGSLVLALGHGVAALVVVGIVALGVGAGLAIGIASQLVAEAVSPTETGIAMSLNSVLRRVGGGIGGQVVAILLATGHAFAVAFWITAIVAGAGALLALGMPAGSHAES